MALLPGALARFQGRRRCVACSPGAAKQCARLADWQTPPPACLLAHPQVLLAFTALYIVMGKRRGRRALAALRRLLPGGARA